MFDRSRKAWFKSKILRNQKEEIMTTIKTIEEEIKQKKLEIEQLQKEARRLAKLSPEIRLAILLHEKQCHYNHTDGCGWFYANENEPEIWVRDATRARYLTRARDLLNVLGGDYDLAVRVVGVF